MAIDTHTIPRPKRITRNCIVCNKDDAETLFTFTYDFLTQVRSEKPEWLEQIGWTKDTTAAIVRCRQCGSKYTRDVFCNFEESKTELTETDIQLKNKTHNSHKQFPQSDKRLWILTSLFRFAHRQFNRDINLLDYGAGSGTWSNTARTLGINRVYAYEPYNPYPPRFYTQFNFPGIEASRSWDEISVHGPFDTMICNAVFEHLITPHEDVQRMYDNLVSGGLLYLHNPYMNIESELDQLKQATQINKKMAISHYHPGHVNYLTPENFRTFVTSFGFKIIPLPPNPFPITSGRQIKSLIKSALQPLGLYKPKEFLLQKP